MTRNQIAERASQALEDEGLIHFTSIDLSDSIQDGYELIALLAQTIEKVVPVTIASNLQIVDLSSYLSDFYRVLAIYNETTKAWLTPDSLLRLQLNGNRYCTHTGNIRNWSPLGDRKILFYPCPVATQSLQIFYTAEPDETTETPVFFVDMHQVLVDYVCSSLLDQNLEYTKGLKYFKLFVEGLEEIRVRMNRRGLQASIMELSCQPLVTPISIS